MNYLTPEEEKIGNKKGNEIEGVIMRVIMTNDEPTRGRTSKRIIGWGSNNKI